MSAVCVSPIKARVVRLVREDVCGVPVTGAGNQVISGGFVSIEASPDYEEGEEIVVKTANGDPCVVFKDYNFLKRIGLTINFCQLDPDAIQIITGESLIVSGSATGIGVSLGGDPLTSKFGLEVWQPVAGAGACTAGGLQQFVYWAFPHVGNAMVGDWTFENDSLTFSLSGETFGSATLWGDGPGTGTSWLPGVLPAGKHMAYAITTVAPPVAVCGAQSLT